MRQADAELPIPLLRPAAGLLRRLPRLLAGRWRGQARAGAHEGGAGEAEAQRSRRADLGLAPPAPALPLHHRKSPRPIPLGGRLTPQVRSVNGFMAMSQTWPSGSAKAAS